LQIVGGLGGVMPTLGELPRDLIINVFIEVEVLNLYLIIKELRFLRKFSSSFF
jgi:hypothetical protein